MRAEYDPLDDQIIQEHSMFPKAHKEFELKIVVFAKVVARVLLRIVL